MSNNSDLIHYSRAGDIFHYRWAAKRCLKLLDFDTDLKHLTIEGSLESNKAGECVIDVAEYYKSKNNNESINYYQLKHSTIQLNSAFTLSLLKDTIIGFSNRFKELGSLKNNNLVFTIITNRPISQNFKENISKISKGEIADATFTKTIKKYTDLSSSKLKKFCSILKLCDGEGDYDAQKYEIHKELSLLTCSKDISNLTIRLVAKITEKIEPGKSNILTINDVLEVFNITNIADFFPAPPLFEHINNFIVREQQDDIITSIRESKFPTLITANGGVGKSILCEHIIKSFGDSSHAVAYDCFGNGSYRRTSQKRHRTRDAFTQISNELAKENLCDQLIPSRQEPDDFWMKAFLERLNDASLKLQKLNDSALLVILFDAVDNAEMAAEELSDTSFAKLLIREKVPENCRIVYTSRPERMHLFDPPSSTNIIELKPFSDQEALQNLQTKFPSSNLKDAKEFNRLTSCNPRVQANAFSFDYLTVENLLLSFGTCTVTVDDLIDKKLKQTINTLNDSFPIRHRSQIDNICTGLATLPPFVPIKVLASVADVSEDTVISFIVELGRPLWMTGDSVQFRDEPTEKWFQDNFSAEKDQVKVFLERLKPLSGQFSYISETLPLLMLKAELFNELVELALSDKYLPNKNPYDSRRIKLFRLQYAFKAALKNQQYLEAGKLALRSGEEIAGDERQKEIILNNCDLASRFLSIDRTQEIAHKKYLSSSWEGSETIYSSSLLSTVAECKGEAQSYLRSAKYWLNRFFEKRDKLKKSQDRFNYNLNDLDIVELTTATFNLLGLKKAVEFILSWTPNIVIFNITNMFTKRLLDSGDFDSVYNMAELGIANPSFILAITNELMHFGKYPSRKCLTRCLNKIVNPKSRLQKPDEISNSSYSYNAFLSFFEACVINNLPSSNIIRALNYYIEIPSLYSVADRHQFRNPRNNFLRFITIKASLKKSFPEKFEDICPKKWLVNKKSRNDKDELIRAKTTINKLLPWHIVTAKILAGYDVDLSEEHKNADAKSKNISESYYYNEYEHILFDITRQRFVNIVLEETNHSEVTLFLNDFKNNKINTTLNDKINILRVCCRKPHLKHLIDTFDISCYKILNIFDAEESPESYSDQYLSLSRAVLTHSLYDSASYFDKAIEIASNFGSEVVARWDAIVTIAKKSTENRSSCCKTAYRFMRCAELIGITVSREKYWDRNDALSTCFMISPESAFAIANRWKERDIGWSYRQINALANSALDSKKLSPSSIYSLTAFSWEYGLFNFYEKCIKKETQKQKQQLIFDSLVRDFRINNTRGKIWNNVNQLALDYKLLNPELNNLKILTIDNKQAESYNSYSSEKVKKEQNWKDLFGNNNISTKIGFKAAFDRFKSLKGNMDNNLFWKGCYSEIKSGCAAKFLEIVSESEFLDFYDIQNAFKHFPSDWKSKLSVQTAWDKAIEYISQRFPYNFTNMNQKHYILESFKNSSLTLDAIKRGVIKGFSESVDIESAYALFGFANYCTSLLTPTQAAELLDYSLTRFDMFIEDDFADGPWNDKLLPPKGTDHALVGFIYTNLGNPRTNERWRAVHSVIRLYKLGCTFHIDLLIDLLITENIHSFIPPHYTFYSLHAKLYLLVAFLRCSSEGSYYLKNKKEIFVQIALSTNYHILIQNYARDIILSIEKDSKGSFENSTLEKIQQLNVSPFPPILKDSYSYKANSPWHIANTINTTEEIYFDHDFESYWFGPLGRVFGISGKEVRDLVADVIVNDWKIGSVDKFIDDPRKELWKNTRIGRETYHSHGSYPETDSYSFYLTYHAILVVAAKLLKKMPIVNNPDYGENSWDEWIKSYHLIGKNNLFIADYRDAFPLINRDWIFKEISDTWRWEVNSQDFINILISKNDKNIWLNVNGNWNEYKNGCNEDISISSVLVPKRLSNAFLNSITNFDDYTQENYLLHYCEDNFSDIELNHEFIAMQWLYQTESKYSIDDNDPFAGDVNPNTYIVDVDLAKKLNISSGELCKYWYFNDTNIKCLINDIWSDDKPEDSEEYYQKGNKVKSSLALLKSICKLLNVDIAIQINISRNLVGNYNNRSNDSYGYLPRCSKTFLFSSDGKIRDTKQSYRVSQKDYTKS